MSARSDRPLGGTSGSSFERRFDGLELAGVQHLAVALARGLSEAARSEAITIGLVGELGAGKTTFARAFVAAVPGGASVRVSSPTYAIIQVYETTPAVRHVDLYRVGGADELDAIGYHEVLDTPGLNLVEWALAVPGALPADWVEIELAARSADVRDIRVRARGARAASLLITKVLLS